MEIRNTDQADPIPFRMARELYNFTNIVLPGKSHLTAIASGYLSKEYAEGLVGFINSHDTAP